MRVFSRPPISDGHFVIWMPPCPEGAHPSPFTWIEEQDRSERLVVTDEATGRVTITDVTRPPIRRCDDIDLLNTVESRTEFEILPGHPGTASVRTHVSATLQRGEWRVAVEASTGTRHDVSGTFVVDSRVVAREGESTVFEREVSSRLP